MGVRQGAARHHLIGSTRFRNVAGGCGPPLSLGHHLDQRRDLIERHGFDLSLRKGATL